MSNLNQAVAPVHKGGSDVWACPSCGSSKFVYSAGFKQNKFCGNCGQPIDWSCATADIEELCKPPYYDVAAIIAESYSVCKDATINFIGSIKPTHRNVVTLHTRHDMTFGTIAKYYNVTQQRISNIYHDVIGSLLAVDADLGKDDSHEDA